MSDLTRRRPVAVLSVIVLTAVITAAVTWVVAGRWSDQRTLDDAGSLAAQPPLTATVHRQDLQSVVSFKGAVAADRNVDIAVPKPADGDDAVVTALSVKPGVTAHEGDRIADISNRPLIVLGGLVTPFRDLRPGDSGADVAELRAALGRLGLLESSAGDTYDGPVKGAITGLYRRAGAEPETYHPDGEIVALRDREAETDRAAEAARLAGDRVGYDQALAARRDARQAVAAFEAQSGPLVRRSEIAVVAGLPMTVSKVAAKLGRQVTPGKDLLTLSSAARSVHAAVPAPVGTQLEAGQAAEVSAAGRRTKAMVARVGAEADRDGNVAVVVGPASPDAAGPVGQSVDVVVTVGSADNALVVPLSALSPGPETSTSVAVVSPSASIRHVRVDVLLEADGQVAIRPHGALRDGQSVLIG